MTHPPASPGRVIAIEGLDGVGKTTLVQALCAELSARRLQTPPQELAPFREILDTLFGPTGDARHLFYFASLFPASRLANEARNRGEWVVIDRYALTTVAYAEILNVSTDLTGLTTSLCPADLTIFLTAPLELRAERMAGRGSRLSDHDRRTLDRDGHDRVTDAYRRLSSLPVAGRWAEVDTANLDATGVLTAALKTCRLSGTV